jgi:hypothetical protein
VVDVTTKPNYCLNYPDVHLFYPRKQLAKGHKTFISIDPEIYPSKNLSQGKIRELGMTLGLKMFL